MLRGSVGLARWARIPAGIVGATIAAFATSAPELSVSVSSALAGKPAVALGDAIGSNVVNLGAILGFVLLMSPIKATRVSVARDFSTALLAPVVIGLLAWDGELSRSDGLILIALFTAWLMATVLEAKRHRESGEEVEATLSVKPLMAVSYSLIGLGLLVLAGGLIVKGAVGIASSYGLDPFTIGATVVALGTSVPELATAIMASARGHEEIGLGTALGSNVFNGLFIVGVASVICPIPVQMSSVGIGIVTGCLLTLFVLPSKQGILGRSRGVLLLITYAIYLMVIIRFRVGA
jgi:cation:H+ antiporter